MPEVNRQKAKLANDLFLATSKTLVDAAAPAAGWLVTVTAGALTFLISNASASSVIGVVALRPALYAFAFMLVCHGAQRMMTFMVYSSIEADAAGKAMRGQTAAMDREDVIGAVTRFFLGMPRFVQCLNRGMLERVVGGEIDATGKRVIRFAIAVVGAALLQYLSAFAMVLLLAIRI